MKNLSLLTLITLLLSSCSGTYMVFNSETPYNVPNPKFRPTHKRTWKQDRGTDRSKTAHYRHKVRKAPPAIVRVGKKK